MNVAVLEPVAAHPQASSVADPAEGPGQVSEWIDPDGDDWFAAIYRELVHDPTSAPTDRDRSMPGPDHWFG